MSGLTYNLEVRRPVPFMCALIDAFCGDAHLSLEGDLSKLRWSQPVEPNLCISAVLRRQTAEPKQDYVVLPLEPETVAEIKRDVLPVVGVRRRVPHVQIEKHGKLVFGAYDGFYPGLVWVSQQVGAGLLERLRKEGCLKSYEANPYELKAGGVEPNAERYVVDLLTEQDVSLDEALRAFGGDQEQARKMLGIYIDTGSVLLVDGGQLLPDWRANEIVRDPELFNKYGSVCMRPGSSYESAREEGRI